MEDWLISAAQKILIAGGGGGVCVAVVMAIKHLLPSGAERLAASQQTSQSAEVRALRWETDYKACETKRQLTQRHVDALSSSHDGMIDFAGSGVTPDVVTRHIKSHARAQKIVDAVKS